jgi:hypothetical protein
MSRRRYAVMRCPISMASGKRRRFGISEPAVMSGELTNLGHGIGVHCKDIGYHERLRSYCSIHSHAPRNGRHQAENQQH